MSGNYLKFQLNVILFNNVGNGKSTFIVHQTLHVTVDHLVKSCYVFYKVFTIFSTYKSLSTVIRDPCITLQCLSQIIHIT